MTDGGLPGYAAPAAFRRTAEILQVSAGALWDAAERESDGRYRELLRAEAEAALAASAVFPLIMTADDTGAETDYAKARKAVAVAEHARREANDLRNEITGGGGYHNRGGWKRQALRLFGYFGRTRKREGNDDGQDD